MPTLEGTTLGHHHLKHLLGRGGMAEVYLGFDEHLHREVAIKVVHQSQDEHFRRFQREAETMGPLAHEHILPVFEYGEQGPWHYLVMPYMPGGTLLDRLKGRGPLTPQEAGRILEQIASALQFAHDRGVLHRDIISNPLNVTWYTRWHEYKNPRGRTSALRRDRNALSQGERRPGTRPLAGHLADRARNIGPTRS
ncbi:serine/threonine-protein kinase [Dictyobacter formicarum]|uniref:non-specific serine/threonine protein kinase n=1 Tax=Dictyobacter formicarum TaxID=2778368 RepID=A0ABQ3VPU3_9CHLR|nr:serine/threonine-protein kinase [Dictyobacter formicarum]GHO87711.1 hypothetical protein KSZ_57170 [Dictyobacter formicarum]